MGHSLGTSKEIFHFKIFLTIWSLDSKDMDGDKGDQQRERTGSLMTIFL